MVICSGNLAILACGRFGCAPLGDNSGTHRATGVARHLLFPVGGASTCFLAIRHLADVGISVTLHGGIGFFGLLHAGSASLPCGWGGHDRRGPERQPFHVLHSIRERLGPLCDTGSSRSVRRATLDDPDSTACLLAPALNSLVWLGSLSRCLRAFNSLTMFSDSSASPGVEAARFATLPGRLHTSDSNPDYGTAQQTHASVEYLRTHAGLGQDCSSQAVPTATSCHN